MGKPLWESKIFWVNIVAVGVMVAQQAGVGYLLPADVEVTLLAVINLALRLITREPIVWG